MIEYFPIYSGEKGLSVRAKLNKSFYDLTVGPEGVNEVWLRLNNLQYLRVAKTYLTLADMLADKSNPIREDGYPLREGELVAVTDDSIEENKGFYRRTSEGFTFMYAFSATSHTQLLDVRTVGDLNLPDNSRDLHITKEFSDRLLELLENPRVSALSELTDVTITSATEGDILVRKGLTWKNIPQSEIIPDFSGYTETDPTVPAHVKAITLENIDTWSNSNHTHHNKNIIDGITQDNLDVLAKFKLVGDKLQIDADTYSTGELSAYGLGDGNIEVLGAISTLLDVQLTNLTTGQYLKYNGTHWVNVDLTTVTLWDDLQGKPTEFNPIAHSHSISDITNLQAILNDIASNTALNTHIENSVIHITDTERTSWNTATTNSHTHTNKAIIDELTLDHLDVLAKLSIVNGNLQIDGNAYSTGELSAYGVGDGGGGGGSDYERLDAWASYDSSKSGWVLSALLGNDLNTRVTDLENSAGGGSVTSVGINVPTGLSVSNSPITSSGVIEIGLETGYSIPTTEKQGQWDAAYTNNHTHTNKTVLDGITSSLVSNWNTAFTNNHTHSNKTQLDLIIQSNIDVLAKLSIVNGNLQIDGNAYATGELSAYGLGTGGSGGGSYYRLDAWVDYDSSKADWVLSALLGKELYDSIGTLDSRINAVEGTDSDKHFVFAQGVPTDTWTVNHNLNKYPSITIVDSGQTEVEGEVIYLDLNTVVVSFSSAFSGRAYLN